MLQKLKYSNCGAKTEGIWHSRPSVLISLIVENALSDSTLTEDRVKNFLAKIGNKQNKYSRNIYNKIFNISLFTLSSILQNYPQYVELI